MNKFIHKTQLHKIIGVFLFILFIAEASSVPKGELFWEINRPGIEPSYIIGSNHAICLNEDSLPPEINTALENSKKA